MAEGEPVRLSYPHPRQCPFHRVCVCVCVCVQGDRQCGFCRRGSVGLRGPVWDVCLSCGAVPWTRALGTTRVDTGC